MEVYIKLGKTENFHQEKIEELTVKTGDFYPMWFCSQLMFDTWIDSIEKLTQTPITNYKVYEDDGPKMCLWEM